MTCIPVPDAGALRVVAASTAVNLAVGLVAGNEGARVALKRRGPLLGGQAGLGIRRKELPGIGQQGPLAQCAADANRAAGQVVAPPGELSSPEESFPVGWLLALG